MVNLDEFKLSETESARLEELLTGAFLEKFQNVPIFIGEGFLGYEETHELLSHVTQDIATVIKLGDGDDFAQFKQENALLLDDIMASVEEIGELVVFGFRLGIEKGSGACMNDLGARYYLGDIVEQDYEKAAKLYEAAADAGCYQGMINLGYIYEYGRTGEPDYQKAYECYALACAMTDSSEAAYKLGDMYSRGKAITRNMTRAHELYERSLNLAHTDELRAQAAIRLAKCIMDGTSESIGKGTDYLLALQLFQMAEIGLRKDIAAGAFYYRKRLNEAIEGQEQARKRLDTRIIAAHAE